MRSTQSWPRAMGIIGKVVSAAVIVRLTGCNSQECGLKKKCFLPLGCKPPAQIQGFSPGRFAAAGNPYGVGQKNTTVCLQTEEQIRLSYLALYFWKGFLWCCSF